MDMKYFDVKTIRSGYDLNNAHNSHTHPKKKKVCANQ